MIGNPLVVGWGITFGTALENLESRVEDCAPHSYLTVALLRSIGVPARPVTGLVLNGNVAGRHVWVEAFLGERAAPDESAEGERQRTVVIPGQRQPQSGPGLP